MDHAKLLTAELQKDFPDAHIFLLSGQGTAKEKRKKLDDLHNVPPDNPLAIVATGKYVGEGFDEPRLDTLFVAMPIAWKGKVSQYAGRLHRMYEGKRKVTVYDYVDIHVPLLERMYHKRLSAYAGLGYSVRSAPVNTKQKTGAIFNQSKFLTMFTHDMEPAGKEILIVSPYISKGRVTQMKPLFWPAMTKGSGVIIFTRPPESFAEASRQKLVTMLEELRSIGVKVILKERIHQKFAVIDHRTVWYGSINPLSYGKSEENMMRFENGEIAEELLMDLEKDASRLFSATVPPLNRQAGERFIRVLL